MQSNKTRREDGTGKLRYKTLQTGIGLLGPVGWRCRLTDAQNNSLSSFLGVGSLNDLMCISEAIIILCRRDLRVCGLNLCHPSPLRVPVSAAKLGPRLSHLSHSGV